MQAVITKVEFEPGQPANVLEVDPVKALHWENVRMAWFEKHGMHEQHQAAEDGRTRRPREVAPRLQARGARDLRFGRAPLARASSRVHSLAGLLSRAPSRVHPLTCVARARHVHAQVLDLSFNEIALEGLRGDSRGSGGGHGNVAHAQGHWTGRFYIMRANGELQSFAGREDGSDGMTEPIETLSVVGSNVLVGDAAREAAASQGLFLNERNAVNRTFWDEVFALQLSVLICFVA